MVRTAPVLMVLLGGAAGTTSGTFFGDPLQGYPTGQHEFFWRSEWMHAQCEPISAPEHGQTDPVQSEAVQARAPFVQYRHNSSKPVLG